eukprot:CAMPEP_0194132278 /NCGR_PEP_ID=MMETSP0152-20130528/2775_1 /TAXON_ID=1049557 /ORGANISM="Thalassiothrix antarctica, Strain L6-D1" /LENGTH=362 /DNA_ID=CAMNT_0038827271 /DNA_START=69 /DNA_END=1157 /DNA_ORIENTATION=+
MAVKSMRLMSSYILDGSTNSSASASNRWPVKKTNLGFNIVPQGYEYVVERFGKMHRIEEPGWFLAIPVVDTISYVIDIRERAIDIPPQSAITRDNVSVEVSGNLFVRFVDPKKAAYGAFNPLYSITQHAQSAMRASIGEMELDEILHGRARLNSMIKGSLQEAADPWGLDVKRYEITEITPDTQIRIAMDKQAAAERDRREHVLRAEGDKQRTQLTSEGVKISLQNESEGNLIRVKNEAEAAKIKHIKEAEGQAEAIRTMAEAQAAALNRVAKELEKEGGMDAAKLALAQNYVEMYGEMGRDSNTMIFNDRPADVSALIVQAVTALKAIDSGGKKEFIDGLGERQKIEIESEINQKEKIEEK